MLLVSFATERHGCIIEPPVYATESVSIEERGEEENEDKLFCKCDLCYSIVYWVGDIPYYVKLRGGVFFTLQKINGKKVGYMYGTGKLARCVVVLVLVVMIAGKGKRDQMSE